MSTESHDESQQGGTATASPPSAPPAPAAPKRQTKPQARTKPRQLPPYQVILLNDDDHTYAYVIDLLMRVFGYEAPKAFGLTQQVDEQGEAVVWSGHKELAELKADQVKGFGPDFYAQHKVDYPLGCRVEPAAGS